MPLPSKSIPWPPLDLATVTPVMQQWSAWYEGTPEALRAAYGRGFGGGVAADARHTAARDARHTGGVKAMLQRFWWGRPTQSIGQSPRDMIHVPIAADICQASADLLFADQPTLKVTDESTQKRLDELANDGMYSTLAEAAEISAALGGVYLRVVWDTSLQADAPFLSAVDADGAWPEFQWGILRAVTFWKVIHQDGQTVWRHLERHELDKSGVGIILHGLYEGTPTDLGRAKPLTERDEMAGYLKAIDAAGRSDSAISTESPGLAVTYIPNQRPQRRWRKDPVGTNYGRSDLDGVESLMDALDEVYSSWMRDIRLGKARIIAAKSMLEAVGPGAGATFDQEQEIYSPVNALATAKDGLQIEQVQFKIRFAEHQETANQLKDDIVRTAGYSAQTFGEKGEIAAQRTATEVDARKERSLLTRDRKIRHWRPGVADALEKLMAVDVALFRGSYPVQRPDVKFSDGVQDSTLSLAQTAQALRVAEAASTEVLVAMVHPDWEDKDIAAEVARIKAEQAAAAAVPDPNGFGQPTDETDPSNPHDTADAGQQ
jgi:A118 family predicted phage portal protein